MSYREPEDKTWIVVVMGYYPDRNRTLMTHPEALEHARSESVKHQTRTYVCKVERAYDYEVRAVDAEL